MRKLSSPTGIYRRVSMFAEPPEREKAVVSHGDSPAGIFVCPLVLKVYANAEGMCDRHADPTQIDIIED